ncbi:2-amino-4-hydroxy-6-hydroxymethyldihydropteridine diphosphokinase [Oleiagrimonas sp. MCCC 1A03011]|uniref:2-amino-4-hydroxy-6- hydroxymethyldihydropteridine diphosphokinase n=1 Tax=Oleiagrimonas sp. MCCC 1A03011 TaxID=1926883 RepID=UPI000DC33FCB|nr:2-amino-4-hydroxy-6-hydroxymethyldihydropteridine diphosphokinase [Oleiagrimonas sp. MCCC 1A03011]RAP58240.1 2-amino-4-hydroxy-6-hydroxymethyldihydropteridine diphosphokinase [Oleiagrimonas sp. MCCC 1A03011]
MTAVLLSLGSNIEPERHLRAALTALRERFGALRISPTYRTASVGFEGAAFLNLGVGLDTDLEPEALNAWLHALEDAEGRRRDGPRFSSRTLDIDIVLFGDRVVRGPGHLQIPRDELRHAFVLKPLVDIAPETVVPGDGRTLAQLWAVHPDYERAFEVCALEPVATGASASKQVSGS